MVILDKEDYTNKVEEHLSDTNTYEILTNDPQKQLQGKVNRKLLKLYTEKKFTRPFYENLYCSAAVTPRFYGLIKTHKENNPIRPIVSFIGSPTYNIAKMLSQVLTPFTNLSEEKVKNSYTAKERIKMIKCNNDDVMVSFDVKSLFTSVPIDLAVNCVKNAIENNPDLLREKTKLSSDDIIDLLKICIHSVTFQWNEKCYKQRHGIPMGSPISVVLAELTMQQIETNMLHSQTDKPKIWIRYLDDVFTIIRKDLVDKYLHDLNAVNPFIQFTTEIESNGNISFLDLHISREINGNLSFNVYRKPTFSGSYLKFDSYNPQKYKRAVVKALSDRAKKICNVDNINTEREKIREGPIKALSHFTV